MYGHRGGEGSTHLHKLSQLRVRVVVIHPQPAFDAEGRGGVACRVQGGTHGGHAVSHQARLQHKRGAEAAGASDAVAGAPAVEVDFVIAVGGSLFRGERGREGPGGGAGAKCRVRGCGWGWLPLRLVLPQL